MDKVEKYINKVIVNIEQDREVTKELLNDVVNYIGKDQSKHTEVGHVAAKYVESLQRSNEQLVKLVTLMAKKQDSLYGDLNDEEKNNIYDKLNENEEA
jgi:hypothetical protein